MKQKLRVVVVAIQPSVAYNKLNDSHGKQSTPYRWSVINLGNLAVLNMAY